MKSDILLDILRCIAIVSIILVHIDPKLIFINQIRSFDVPLMVFLFGVSSALGNSVIGRPKLAYSSYYMKRFKRLILPSWIFLLICYILFHTTYFLYSSNAHILWLDPMIRPVLIIHNDFVRFAVVILTAIAITYCQEKIVNKLCYKIKSVTIQKFLRTIFIG